MVYRFWKCCTFGVALIVGVGCSLPLNASADHVLFNMVPEPADFSRDALNPDHRGTLTRDGITATFTAQGDGGLLDALGDLVFSTDSFGMSIVDGLNDEHLLDVSQSDSFGDIHEQIVVSFDQTVRLNEIVLDTLGAGDEANLFWSGGGSGLLLADTGFFTDVYDLSSADIVINAGENFTLLHKTGGGFSFENFSVTAVPEPSSLALFGFSALLAGIRRRRTLMT